MQTLIRRLLRRTSNAAVARVAGRDCRRLVKRIDETRELVDLLQTQTPEFLRSHPWVLLWLEDNDSFLVDLVEAVGEPALIADARHRSDIWLRSWPVPLIASGTVASTTAITQTGEPND